MIKTNNKILYVITQGGPWGGAQKYVYTLSKNIPNGMDAIVAVGESNRNQDLQKKLVSNNIEVINLKNLERNISIVKDWKTIVELRKLYKTIKPHIVHLNSSKAGVLGSVASIGLKDKPKIVYTVHGWVFNEPMGSIRQIIYKFAEKISATLKDSIITLSEYEKKQAITKLGISIEKIHKIPIGVAKQDYLPKDEARSKIINTDYNQDEVLIVSIANAFKTKGLDTLIKATEKLLTNNIKIRVFIIGDGPELANLKKLSASLGVNNSVHFLGFIENASNLLMAFDLFVLPSKKEGLPYVALEAKQAGVPIITTAVGGLPTIIENKKNGLLIKPGSSENLANAIKYACSHMNEMKSMSSTAKDESESYSEQDMIRKTYNLYNKHL